ncbi:hypothetical protein [Streptomyces sp. enrichment culture]|uniref:hypothetical protein n=1 Tax=Streptomyces sp. enrichment culture TaxID=1795815 RepID=UPI003F566914
MVLCGRNERLRASLTGFAGVLPLGWRDDMPGLTGAALALVDNAGGLTELGVSDRAGPEDHPEERTVPRGRAPLERALAAVAADTGG